ncbi:MAG: hypothetical protein JNK85_18555 [Verrucomicrobiales bacterium]|nr:hypothetical protein [Verrucomicrobiales bacterium]
MKPKKAAPNQRRIKQVYRDSGAVSVFVYTVGKNTEGVHVFGAGDHDLGASPSSIEVKVLHGACMVAPKPKKWTAKKFTLAEGVAYAVTVKEGGYCVWRTGDRGQDGGNHPRKES